MNLFSPTSSGEREFDSNIETIIFHFLSSIKRLLRPLITKFVCLTTTVSFESFIREPTCPRAFPKNVRRRRHH